MRIATPFARREAPLFFASTHALAAQMPKNTRVYFCALPMRGAIAGRARFAFSLEA